MNYLQALILGLVEGASEFLPISSTAHLILTSRALQITTDDFTKTFEIAIQSGAIFAVVWLYRQKLFNQRNLWRLYLVAFLPTAVVGFALYQFIKDTLLTYPLISIEALIIGGFVLILWEKTNSASSSQPEKPLTLAQAFTIGCIQSISIIPGVSRAGATILGGLLVGLTKNQAIEFSFLLAIPTILAATGLELAKNGQYISLDLWPTLAIGFVTAFVSSLVVIKWFISYLKHHSFTSFGWYRIAVAILFLLTI